MDANEEFNLARILFVSLQSSVLLLLFFLSLKCLLNRQKMKHMKQNFHIY